MTMNTEQNDECQSCGARPIYRTLSNFGYWLAKNWKYFKPLIFLLTGDGDSGGVDGT